jgi:hypothetical protein
MTAIPKHREFVLLHAKVLQQFFRFGKIGGAAADKRQCVTHMAIDSRIDQREIAHRRDVARLADEGERLAAIEHVAEVDQWCGGSIA